MVYTIKGDVYKLYLCDMRDIKIKNKGEFTMNQNDYIICRKCGQKLSPNSLKCTNCGTPVEQSGASKKSNLCSVLATLVLIGGILGSVYYAFVFGVDVRWDDDKFDFTVKQDAVKIIFIFARSMVPTLIIYAILDALGTIKSQMNYILDNIGNLAIGTPQNGTGASTNQTASESVSEDETWRCPECGQEHPMYVSICHCGTPRKSKK